MHERMDDPPRTPAWLSFVARKLGYRVTPVEAQQPRTDELTGLSARDQLLHRLEMLLAERAQGGPYATPSGVAVLRIDIDDLERVNEALSHAAGDIVIVALAQRIATIVGDPKNVSRIAGAAFAALVPTDGADASAVEALAHQVRRAVSDPVIVSGHYITSKVSIGVAFEDAADGAETALQNATLAVRRARELGGDRVELADRDLAMKARQRLELEEEMRRGLDADEFRAWYQPIVDFVDGHVVGYEALIRWFTPDGRQVFPGEFIPVAESCGLVPDLDALVLAQALERMADLPDPQFIAVNVSPVSLMRPDFVRRASALLSVTGVNLTRLHLEVTETALPSNLDVVRSAMLHLSMGGAQWYFDDFGTGYSSMSNLGDLPVDGLKLDMSFTRGIHAGDETSRRLAHGLLGLARGLELDTVAEGVETDAVASILREQGWEHGQGWLYGKAAPLNAA